MRKFLFLIAALASASASAHFIDGNELSKWIPSIAKVQQKIATDSEYGDYSQFVGYVQGAYDANDLFLCTPSRFSTRQLNAVVAEYIKANPQKWHLPGDKLVVLSVSEAFPCPKVAPSNGELDKPKKK